MNDSRAERAGSFFERLLKRLDRVGHPFGFQVDPPQVLEGLGRLRVDLLAVVRTLLQERRRLVEDDQHFAQALLRLIQLARLFLHHAQVVTDLGADLQAVFESRTGGGAREDGAGFLRLAQRAQLTRVAIAGLEIVGIEFEDAPAGGQGVVHAIQGEVKGDKRAMDGRRLRVQTQGLLVGVHRFD